MVAVLVACGGGAERAGPLGRHASDPASGIAAADIPAPVREGLAIGEPEQLPADRHAMRWAALRRPTIARARPSRRAHALARLSSRTPEGTTNLVVVLGSRRNARGRQWIRARLPARGMLSGWLPRSALGAYGVVHTRLIVDRARLRLTLLRDGRPVFRAPVGIGRPRTPTPGGLFYVRDRVTRYASAFYGPIAFGTSARSRTLTDWPGGGFVGIHGTDRPDLVPGRVSHGCIRMRNADIRRLAELMPVGTPLQIR